MLRKLSVTSKNQIYFCVCYMYPIRNQMPFYLTCIPFCLYVRTSYNNLKNSSCYCNCYLKHLDVSVACTWADLYAGEHGGYERSAVEPAGAGGAAAGPGWRVGLGGLRRELGHTSMSNHRRRINIEEKAQVVAAFFGERIYWIPCRSNCFH